MLFTAEGNKMTFPLLRYARPPVRYDMVLCGDVFSMPRLHRLHRSLFLSHTAHCRLHGHCCRCLAHMDELAMAAATLAVSMDVDDDEEIGVEATSGTSAATEVLSAIDANRGVLGSLDALSNFPSKARGASSSYINSLFLALFGPGPDRRQQA